MTPLRRDVLEAVQAMRRWFALLVLALAVGLPTITFAADTPPRPPGGDGQFQSTRRTVGIGGRRTGVNARSERSGWANTRRGTERVTFWADGAAPDADGAAGPIGPESCGDGPLIIPPSDMTVPTYSIRTTPAQAGVVGTYARFWLDGQFDGTIFTRPVEATYSRSHPTFDPDMGAFVQCTFDEPGHVTVRLHFWPVRYRWNYGDGTETQTFECSAITHNTTRLPADCPFGLHAEEVKIQYTYEVSSAAHNDEGGYRVVASVELSMGVGPDNDDMTQVTTLLEDVPDRTWLRYQVREVQSVLVD